ncbi:MAG TPA: non-homologous end-joining DNA ligase, partial [Opitutaceae bacterium]|nr:non-homologous end-joining DNA ligase [Opitutaceae bacterium]
APEVRFTNPEKIFFPATHFTKAEMIHYYVDAAPYILPHLRDRPVTLVRFPDGVTSESFYEKNAPSFTPDWVSKAAVPRRNHEGEINYILVNDVNTLAWCANLAAIEFHPFLHRVPDIEKPTHIVFDLDPGEGSDVLTCARVAFLLKEILDKLGLESFAKASGSKGMQIYVPLNTRVTYDATGPFARTVAELLAQEHADLVVSNMSKALRKKKVLIDWSQNSRSKTTVSVYSMRAKHAEPYISMPVEWGELKTALHKKDLKAFYFTPKQALARMKKKGDLFEPVLTLKQKLPSAFMAQVSKTSRPLEAYKKKRDFSKTKEPAPTRADQRKQTEAGGRRFVIQKHAASHLHYDFRLEMDGVLKSWAIPKGVPYELGVKRSAFATEDHPLEYFKFEGTIPKGQYGGGTVMVWDIGTYDVTEGSFWKGSMKISLKGKKLKGLWHMFKIRSDGGKDVWLIAKSEKPMKPLSARDEDKSVLTGRSMAQIAQDDDAQWHSDRSPDDENTVKRIKKKRAVPAG